MINVRGLTNEGAVEQIRIMSGGHKADKAIECSGAQPRNVIVHNILCLNSPHPNTPFFVEFHILPNL